MTVAEEGAMVAPLSPMDFRRSPMSSSMVALWTRSDGECRWAIIAAAAVLRYFRCATSNVLAGDWSSVASAARGISSHHDGICHHGCRQHRVGPQDAKKRRNEVMSYFIGAHFSPRNKRVRREGRALFAPTRLCVPPGRWPVRCRPVCSTTPSIPCPPRQSSRQPQPHAPRPRRLKARVET